MINFNQPTQKDRSDLIHIKETTRGLGKIPQLKISNMFIKRPKKEGETQRQANSLVGGYLKKEAVSSLRELKLKNHVTARPDVRQVNIITPTAGSGAPVGSGTARKATLY